MIHDISPALTHDLAVWPGDLPLSRQVSLDLRRGDSVTLSSMNTTVHLGAHADAPSHFSTAGACIGSQPLEPYLGPCQLIHLANAYDGLIDATLLPTSLSAPRVLIRTGLINPPAKFPPRFPALSVRLVEQLAELGTILIGVDTPSVDPFDSTSLAAHHACHRHGIAILEGLRLEGIPEGSYELIALPLKLVGFDASPVRAILRTLPASSV